MSPVQIEEGAEDRTGGVGCRKQCSAHCNCQQPAASQTSLLKLHLTAQKMALEIISLCNQGKMKKCICFSEFDIQCKVEAARRNPPNRRGRNRHERHGKQGGGAKHRLGRLGIL